MKTVVEKCDKIANLINHGLSDREIAAECSFNKLTKADLIDCIRYLMKNFPTEDQVEKTPVEPDNIINFKRLLDSFPGARNYMLDLREAACENTPSKVRMVIALRNLFLGYVIPVGLVEAKNEVDRVFAYNSRFFVDEWIFNGIKLGGKNKAGDWVWTPMPGE